jgi:hypothetical protein
MNQEEFFEKLNKDEFVGEGFEVEELLNKYHTISGEGLVYNLYDKEIAMKFKEVFDSGFKGIKSEMHYNKRHDKYQVGIYKF